jgi:hypothetical protein
MGRFSPGFAQPLLIVALGLGSVACSERESPEPSLRELVEELSEDGGYFDTDNLISNETAYVQVVSRLEPSGGVYVGVGPEQNFHYIGRLRPRWAFIVDVRRDNMLHHLLLNAVLAKGDTPYEYLCFLFSRRCEAERGSLDFDEMVSAVDEARPDEALFRRNLEAIREHVRDRLHFSLGEEDSRVVEFIYRSFFEEQLELRFKTHGRAPMPHHPSYRSLLVARGPDGASAHFLARPEDYDYVRKLSIEGRLVPVVGDFAGTHALSAVGSFTRTRGEVVTAFYVSNVEFYLLRDGSFARYAENVRSLPRSESSRFIRAYFSYGYPHPATLPGHRSTLVRQSMNRFLELYDEGAYSDYWDVSTVDYER